jgi:hypothetical protein
MPSINATSVCGRGAIHSAFRYLQVSVRMGSMTMTFLPLSLSALRP